MKVGLFVADYSPDVGGGFTFQSDILQSLSKLAGESKHEFVVFTNHKSMMNVKKLLETGNIEIIGYRPPRFLWHLVASVLMHFQLLNKVFKKPSSLDLLARKTGVDIIWFISPESEEVDMPYITVVWDLQHRLQPWFPEVSANGIWQYRENYHLRILKRATFIITGTEAGRKEIERFYGIPRDNIKILPHPTPRYALNTRTSSAEDVLKKYGLSKGYLLYPAQFWSHKNHANLLLSLKSLKEKHGLNFSLVLAGSDKGNLDYIKKLTKDLELTEQVHFLGFVPQEDLVLLYRNAFALTYMSFFGPENLPPLEAFALGCPVIASRVSGAEEQLSNAAILVDPRRPDELAQVIESLYENPDLRNTLIKRGLERASSWTGEDFIRGIFSMLDEFEPIGRCWESNS
jgi:glycosyltransferase involved in cell wall biosynthesis